jgi:hypothetical protein
VIRTHQRSWLKRVAEREDVPVSTVFATLIETCCAQIVNRPPTKEFRAHVMIGDNHLQMLEQMARAAGVNRSEMARRMIDQALTKERVGR